MKPLWGSVALALLPSLGQAQAQLTPQESAFLPRLIDHACLELIEAENGCEEVFLLGNEDGGADLVILPDSRNGANAVPLLLARDFAFNGQMWGQSPMISQRENGSLMITAEQSAIGRSVWEMALTLAWREGQFVVAGMTYTDHDKNSMAGVTCDINLLSGAWKTEIFPPQPLDANAPEPATIAKSGKLQAKPPAAAGWTQNTELPPPCAEASAAEWDLISAQEQ